ncbi:unnamed protein product, partial [Heterosigma akashiwo]
ITCLTCLIQKERDGRSTKRNHHHFAHNMAAVSLLHHFLDKKPCNSTSKERRRIDFFSHQGHHTKKIPFPPRCRCHHNPHCSPLLPPTPCGMAALTGYCPLRAGTAPPPALPC